MEPVLLGLLVAPSSSGLALGLAAMLVFVARTPVKILLVDRWRERRTIRAALAARVATLELLAIVGLVLLAAATARGTFWWPLAVASPLVVVEFWFDMRSRGRRLVPELAGVVGIGSMAASIALAGGAAPAAAVGLWLVIGARGVAAVTFIRVQLHRAKSQPFRVAASDFGQAVAIGLAVAGLALDLVPIAAGSALGVVALFHLVMVRRRPAPVAMLGAQQVVLGLLVVLVAGLAVRGP